MGSDAEIQGAADSEVRSAICVYLIGELPEGATIGELARLALGGRAPAEEVDHVSKAVPHLMHEGEVTTEGERVVLL